MNDLKAALNAAGSANRKKLPAEFPTVVKCGLATRQARTPVAREKPILADSDVRRLLIAARDVDIRDGWEGDLYRIVLVLAATGARFSQVARLTVGDFQQAKSRLMIPSSLKGRGEKSEHHMGCPIGPDVVEALRLVAARRGPSAPLLERWRHVQVAATGGGLSGWTRDSRGPWGVAAELSRPWRQVVKHAKIPEGTVAYALRHSSIVRQLRAGLPVRLVASLHDTSIVMIERHYARYIDSALEELAARAVVPLAPVDHSANVARFPRHALGVVVTEVVREF